MDINGILYRTCNTGIQCTNSFPFEIDENLECFFVFPFSILNGLELNNCPTGNSRMKLLIFNMVIFQHLQHTALFGIHKHFLAVAG